MAVVSFADLDQSFSIFDLAVGAFQSQDPNAPGFDYSFLTTGSHDWEFDGVGLTSSGGVLTGGTVDAIQLDLDNDSESTPEIVITGLGGVAAANFGIGVGTSGDQRTAFWRAALSGEDTFNFVLSDYAVDLVIAGDGATAVGTSPVAGANDVFAGVGVALTGNSWVVGDFFFASFTAFTGGADRFTVGAKRIVGDFATTAGMLTEGIGGNDTITPDALDDNAADIITIVGDAHFHQAAHLTGGADLIDLRNTNVSGLSTTVISIVGDVMQADTGIVVGGQDTVFGSSRGEGIWGEYNTSSVSVVGEADLLSGLGGDDSIFGQGGADTISGGAGADSLDGGDGADVAIYSDATAGVTIRLWNGTGANNVAAGDVLTNIENVTGSGFNDVLIGADAIANRLEGAAGSDYLAGLSGNDFLIGGFGADTIDGGFGADTVSYADATGSVTIRLWNGTGTNNVAAGDVLTNIENVAGGNFADNIVGADVVANWLGGGNGADYIQGLSGADTLVGGSGNDSLAGGSGADRHDFSAGSGADRVFSFISGAGVWDTIRITGYGAAFDSFAEILANSLQVGADTVINLGGGNTITLVGVLKTSLVADDFTFI